VECFCKLADGLEFGCCGLVLFLIQIT